MMTRKLSVVASILLSLSAAYSQADELSDPPAQFVVATFNAGLAPLDVDYATERAPAVVAAVQALPADLLCIQEVWLQSDWDTLVAATSDGFPNTVRRPAEPVEAFCTLNELGPLQACVVEACDPTVAGDALGACALANCGSQVAGLSAGCANRLMTSIGGGADMAGLQRECLGDGEGSAEAYLYDGAYDVGILTSAPIVAQASLALDSYLLRASVEYVQVETPMGRVDVYCTHLASPIPQLPYRGALGSWEAEQRHQIEQVIAFIGETSISSTPVILLGDLNVGPDLPAQGLVGEWPEHYQALVRSGLSNPYLSQPNAACTACSDNTLASEDTRPQLIDHILVRDLPGSAEVVRGFTEPALVDAPSGLIETHLSDHYGLVMTLRGAGGQ